MVTEQTLEEWLESEEGHAEFLEALGSGASILECFQKARNIDRKLLDTPMDI